MYQLLESYRFEIGLVNIHVIFCGMISGAQIKLTYNNTHCGPEIYFRLHAPVTRWGGSLG